MEPFFSNIGYLAHGALITIALAAVAIVVGSLLGIATGLGTLLGPTAARRALRLWIFGVRGVPVLVLMFIVYFAFPAFGIRVNGFFAVALSLSVYVAAFYAEVFRGAVTALPRGQREAGLAIGLSRLGVVREVLLPQAVPLMAAPWLNISVIAVKSTAYASIVGVWELTMASREVVERTLEPFPVFFGAMLMYFVICFPLSRLARRLAPRAASGSTA
jgi:His/Glu/Gln/Arg/opine family amino acid ABC transporter permease subunit